MPLPLQFYGIIMLGYMHIAPGVRRNDQVVTDKKGFKFSTLISGSVLKPA
jgi:hypothetical protein